MQVPEIACSQVPVGSMQVSVVQTLPSLQSFGDATHTPPLQWSPTVQASPSSHAPDSVIWVTAEAELLAAAESTTSFETVAVLVVDVTGTGSVPTHRSTLTMRVNWAEALMPRLAAEQLIAPVPPTGGVVQVHPAGAPTDANVVFGGVVSASLRLTATCGPLFVTVIW